MKRFITLASTSILGLAIFTSSQAAEIVRSRTVHFADLDITRVEGAAALYGRIKRAARLVCDEHNSRELPRRKQYTACYETAVSNAIAQVNQPVLTDYVVKHSDSRQRFAATFR
jgi:UrcA family protein